MEHKNLNVVLGPPGTGKTTTLLNLVDNTLKKGIKPNEIGYLAFTRKAALEAIDRAKIKFGYTEKDLEYFRTIHSLCFRILHLSKDDVMKTSHYEELAKILGLEINGYISLDEGQIYGMALGDRLFFQENLSRMTNKPLKEVFNNCNDDDVQWLELERLSRALKKFKVKRHLIDFTDMLTMCRENQNFPKLKALFIDEAQDLSSLQWDIISILAKNAKTVYIAGDDDQAIYRWAGADVDKFISLAGKCTVLTKSYRVPKSIHTIAIKLAAKIKNRRLKTWQSKLDDGKVNWYLNAEDVDLDKGQWYLLARNGYMLRELENICIRNGYPYSINNRAPHKSEAVHAILSWQDLCKGSSITGSNVKLIYKYMSERCPRGIDPEKYFTLHELGFKNVSWHYSLDKISPRYTEYYLFLLKRGEDLTAEPRIRISTIHGVKGGESDNVLLLTDLAPRTYREMNNVPDDELRVFYVAITRAKKSLHVVQPKTNMYFSL